MRVGLWILASCGIVSLILSVGLAEDNPFADSGFSFGNSSTRPSEPKTTSRFFSPNDSSGDRLIESESSAVKNAADIDAVPRSVTTGMRTPSRYTRLRRASFDGKNSSADKTRLSPTDRNYLRNLFSAGRPTAVATPLTFDRHDVFGCSRITLPSRRTRRVGSASN